MSDKKKEIINKMRIEGKLKKKGLWWKIPLIIFACIGVGFTVIIVKDTIVQNLEMRESNADETSEDTATTETTEETEEDTVEKAVKEAQDNLVNDSFEIGVGSDINHRVISDNKNDKITLNDIKKEYGNIYLVFYIENKSDKSIIYSLLDPKIGNGALNAQKLQSDDQIIKPHQGKSIQIVFNKEDINLIKQNNTDAKTLDFTLLLTDNVAGEEFDQTTTEGRLEMLKSIQSMHAISFDLGFF